MIHTSKGSSDEDMYKQCRTDGLMGLLRGHSKNAYDILRYNFFTSLGLGVINMVAHLGNVPARNILVAYRR